MKIAVVTLYHPNYQALADIVLPNWTEYCDAHGYHLTYSAVGWPNQNWAIGFQKMAFVETILPHYDLILVLDLDILFTNLTLTVESFATGDFDYWVTKDANGLNNGAFIIRGEASGQHGGRTILDYMLARAGTHTNEQDTIKYDLDKLPFASRIKILDHPSINSLAYHLYGTQYGDPAKVPGNWEPGHLLLHLPGTSLETRLQVFTSPEIVDQICVPAPFRLSRFAPHRLIATLAPEQAVPTEMAFLIESEPQLPLPYTAAEDRVDRDRRMKALDWDFTAVWSQSSPGGIATTDQPPLPPTP